MPLPGSSMEHNLPWPDVGVVDELSGPPQKGQELVVIQSPDTMRASRFQPTGR